MSRFAPAAPTSEEAPAPLGPVSVLDIGGDVGAVVVVIATVAGQQLLTRHGADVELYACPRDRPGQRFHTGVHRRPGQDGREALVAVFPELEAGDYSLLDPSLDETWREVTPIRVEGGRVTELEI